MARSYGTATLTLTVTEAITLNSKDEGQTHVHTIASISDIYRRTMTRRRTTSTRYKYTQLYNMVPPQSI